MQKMELLNNHRLVVLLPYESTAQPLCGTVTFPPGLEPLTNRSAVENINSVALGVLIAAEAIPESFFITLDLLNLYHRATASVAIVALAEVKQPRAQVAINGIKILRLR